ncbi:MAG: tRNA uridine-5-carboxymethylaminomethyl(34) synthesis GTPase MnmE [Flavobacteriales bacterium]|nr:MAG: tRNA uridine-5-carboxymethylaminomethyl(34) synthesis GTPase MnmE [Flavobacteriales bacterium]
MPQYSSSTICALATASGIGAIAIIRLSGADAITICNKVFFGKDLAKVESHTVHFGTIRAKEKIVDEVLVTVFKDKKSFTGENSVEISTHGSPYIQQQVLQLLITNGAISAGPGEFTLRAFLNGKLDLSQAEAVADVIAANSETSHELAMNQMRGGFSSEIQKLREELIHFASLIELELDFGEEDVEFADREDLKELVENLNKALMALISSFDYGNVIKTGVPVAIVGRPNAGKSTLLNSLLNEDRAIVSATAGTTRDTIEEMLNINGVQFRFVDTAGLRETTDELEKIGVEKAFEQIEKSAIYLYLFDINALSLQEVEEDLGQLNAKISRLVIANKTDLVDADKLAAFKKLDCYFISAKENDNLEKLKESLFNAVTDNLIKSNDVVVTNVRHYGALSKANESLNTVLEGLGNNITGDFLAMDIRQALHQLGMITGDITTDDLLDNIFSKFCIGK